tara:strand:- start:938 stop:1126 length:189 start_codon:yes stop_codon:yes gene_type:complete
MEIFIIFNTNCYGDLSLIATTNNLDKWLKDHNKERVSEGNEPDELDDFEIVEDTGYIYEEKS